MSRRTAFLALPALLSFLAAPVPADARPVAKREVVKKEACQPISKEEVAGLFDQWNDALASKKPAAVVALYAPDATLLPTVQDGPLIGRDPIERYFTYFLRQSPSAVIGARIIKTGCNIAYDIGLYTFTLDGDDQVSHKLVNARYTFIYAPEHGKWRIVHNHSSAFPEPPP